jgi:hypothetical protein
MEGQVIIRDSSHVQNSFDSLVTFTPPNPLKVKESQKVQQARIVAVISNQDLPQNSEYEMDDLIYLLCSDKKFSLDPKFYSSIDRFCHSRYLLVLINDSSQYFYDIYKSPVDLLPVYYKTIERIEMAVVNKNLYNDNFSYNTVLNIVTSSNNSYEPEKLMCKTTTNILSTTSNKHKPDILIKRRMESMPKSIHSTSGGDLPPIFTGKYKKKKYYQDSIYQYLSFSGGGGCVHQTHFESRMERPFRFVSSFATIGYVLYDKKKCFSLFAYTSLQKHKVYVKPKSSDQIIFNSYQLGMSIRYSAFRTRENIFVLSPYIGGGLSMTKGKLLWPDPYDPGYSWLIMDPNYDDQDSQEYEIREIEKDMFIGQGYYLNVGVEASFFDIMFVHIDYTFDYPTIDLEQRFKEDFNYLTNFWTQRLSISAGVRVPLNLWLYL